MAKHAAKRGKTKQKPVKKTRRELRKEKRKEKKSIKNTYFSRKKNVAGKYVTNPDSKDDIPKMQESKKPIKPVKTPEQLKLEKEEKIALKMKKEEKELRRIRNKQLKKTICEDDKYIKKIEKELRLNKRKSKNLPRSYAMDGLAYVVEFMNEDHEDEFAAFQSKVEETGSEFEEDFAIATGQQKASSAADFDSGHESFDENDDSESDSDFDDCASNMSDLTEGVGENVAAILKKVFKSEPSDKKVRKLSKRKLAEIAGENSSEDVNLNVNTKKKKKKSVSFAPEIDSSVEENGNKSDAKLLGKKTKKRIAESSDVPEQFDIGISDSVIVKSKKQKVSETKQSGKVKKENKTKTDHSVKTKKKKAKEKVNETKSESDDDLDCFGLEDDAANEDTHCEEEKKNAVWEDIYGRTRDTAGNVLPSAKYVPPHLREKHAGTDKALLRLRAQMKGLLNRLAENNMKSIADQIEEFYMSHSRYDTSQTLTELLTGSLISGVLTPDRLVAEHVMLVAILHANVGTEVGAHLLQAVVTKFSEVFATNPMVEDKHLDNILLIIAHLYNFKVFASDLAYDILNQLTEQFGEKAVELILLFLKTVGSNLRKDNPIALKDLIGRMQTKAGNATDLGDGTRVKFMMDVLLAIKNNNMTKIPNYDPSHADHLKKVLRSFLRQGNYVSELKISLQDLLKADERGRWWVVGSAWSGSEVTAPTGGAAPSTAHRYSAQVLALAKKQRMNTDTRRNIFCVIMTAEDYLDAFEKLLHLGLKSQQEREIVHVIVDCCLQEKVFNPYYVHLAHKFCVFDRKYMMAVQYLLWDKLKELGNMASVQLTNLAKFLSHMFIEPQGLSLSVLKVIHFAEVDKPTVRLVRQTLLGLLLTESEEACCAAFARVAQAEKLHLFREGLRLFLHHFVLRNTQNLPPEDLEKLRGRIAMADKALGASHHATLF